MNDFKKIESLLSKITNKKDLEKLRENALWKKEKFEKDYYDLFARYTYQQNKLFKYMDKLQKIKSSIRPTDPNEVEYQASLAYKKLEYQQLKYQTEIEKIEKLIENVLYKHYFNLEIKLILEQSKIDSASRFLELLDAYIERFLQHTTVTT